jgi:hypothetical protein
MNGVPADLDLTPFIGADLTLICVGPFWLQFRFSTGASGGTIGVEGSWSLSDANGSTIDESDDESDEPVGMSPGNRGGWRLRELLNDKVESGQVDPPRSFSLTFASGHRLTIFDDNYQHESFSIEPGDIHV